MCFVTNIELKDYVSMNPLVAFYDIHRKERGSFICPGHHTRLCTVKSTSDIYTLDFHLHHHQPINGPTAGSL
jgi:hypothetical protein